MPAPGAAGAAGAGGVAGDADAAGAEDADEAREAAAAGEADGAEVSGTQGVVLPLCGGALRVEYETDGDVGGCDPEQMLAARLAAGAIRADAIRVRNVVWE